MTNLIRPTDSAACDLARDLMANARFAALGTLTGKTFPMVTRIAFGLTPDGEPLSLISQLAAHTTALKEDPVCSLLIGEPGPKGDPLTHPRLTLQTTADIIPRAAADHEKMAAHYLHDHPKAKLYVGFTDFCFVRFSVQVAHLNGGFGKAFVLTPRDLIQPG